VWALDSYFIFLHEFVFFEALVLVLVLIGKSLAATGFDGSDLGTRRPTVRSASRWWMSAEEGRVQLSVSRFELLDRCHELFLHLAPLSLHSLLDHLECKHGQQRG
jgi:hypothetical protein